MPSLLLIFLFWQNPDSPGEPPFDPSPMVAAFQMLDQLIARDEAPLWKRPFATKLLMVDPVTRAAFCNRPLPSQWFKSTRSIWIGSIPLGPDLSQAKLDWAGHSLPVLQLPLPTHDDDIARIMMVALWQNHAVELGIPTELVDNAHLRQTDARIWMRLEWKALAKALQSTGLAQRAAIADAITFRRHRRSLTQNAAYQEQMTELHLGLAAYTALKLHRGDRAVEELLASLPRWEAHQDFSQSFAYWSGPAYGLLLDQHRPDWREHIHDRQDLALMLEIGMKLIIPQAWYDAATLRARPYHLVPIQQDETARAERLAKRIADLRQTFVASPTLRVDNPGPIQVQRIAGNLSLEPDGFWVPTLNLTGPWGKLQASQGVRLQGAHVFLAQPLQRKENQLSGPGWHLSLAQDWEVQPGDRENDFILVITQELEDPP